MTTESIASRRLNLSIEDNREEIRRTAERVAESAARMAEDPDKMVSFGEETRIAQDVQELVIRATRLSALKEAAELNAADREG